MRPHTTEYTNQVRARGWPQAEPRTLAPTLALTLIPTLTLTLTLIPTLTLTLTLTLIPTLTLTLTLIPTLTLTLTLATDPGPSPSCSPDPHPPSIHTRRPSARSSAGAA